MKILCMYYISFKMIDVSENKSTHMHYDAHNIIIGRGAYPTPI